MRDWPGLGVEPVLPIEAANQLRRGGGQPQLRACEEVCECHARSRDPRITYYIRGSASVPCDVGERRRRNDRGSRTCASRTTALTGMHGKETSMSIDDESRAQAVR